MRQCFVKGENAHDSEILLKFSEVVELVRKINYTKYLEIERG
jgi:hypothetical protein